MGDIVGISGAVDISDDDWMALATGVADVGRWVYDDQTGHCHLDEALLRLTGIDEPQPMDAGGFFARIADADRDAVSTSFSEAIANDEMFDMNFRFICPDGREIWLRGRGRPLRQPDGRTVVIGVNYDVTDLQTAVTANRLLANEMAHRVKNIISLISGIFRMAQRGAEDVDTLGTAFLGRLEALSALNELIFNGETRQVAVRDLFHTVFAPLSNDSRVSLALPDFVLNGTAAQTLVLSVNELMTNAVKYGALARDDGRLEAGIAIDEAEDRFELFWRETVPGGISEPGEGKGFGMTVLTQMTRHTFDGVPSVAWGPEGLSFSCCWQASDMRGGADILARGDRLMEEAARATRAVQQAN